MTYNYYTFGKKLRLKFRGKLGESYPNFAEGEPPSVKRLVFSHENLKGTFAAQGKTVRNRR
jgi:hypothetical protein